MNVSDEANECPESTADFSSSAVAGIFVQEDSGWCYYKHPQDILNMDADQWCMDDLKGILFAPTSKELAVRVKGYPTW